MRYRPSEPSQTGCRRCATASCSRGPLDLLVQFARDRRPPTRPGATRAGRSRPTTSAPRSPTPATWSTLERSMHTLIEADVQNWALDAGWAGEVARWGYANLHFKGSCLALLRHLLRLPRQLRLRAQHGDRRDGDLGALLLALPDRAAPLPRGARASTAATAVTGNNTAPERSRTTRSSTRSRPCPRCTSASPSSSRVAGAARPAALAQGPALRLPAADDLRRRRHRQPLLDRRPVRRDGRRGAGGRRRARPRPAAPRLVVQGRPRRRRGRAGRRERPRSRRRRRDRATSAPWPPRPRSCPRTCATA